MTQKHALTTFIENAENEGVVDERTVASIAATLELDDDELEVLRDELEARGVELVASDNSEESADDGPELRLEADVVATTDSLTLFMNEIGKHELLTAAEEVELAKRIERGDKAA